MEKQPPTATLKRNISAPASTAGGVSLYGASVEYGIHSVLWLVQPRANPSSSKDLAELQGIPAGVMAKILPKLEKAGIVTSTSGINGGYRLGRPPEDITVLDVVDAIEGGRHVFDCKEVRKNCILFNGNPPEWVGRGVCGIHAVMLRAEKSMRAEMARTTLLDLTMGIKAPADYGEDADRWLGERVTERQNSRTSAVKISNKNRAAND